MLRIHFLASFGKKYLRTGSPIEGLKLAAKTDPHLTGEHKKTIGLSIYHAGRHKNYLPLSRKAAQGKGGARSKRRGRYGIVRPTAGLARTMPLQSRQRLRL